MGEIKLEYVISYSSQDSVCKAENLLHNPGSKPWLCSMNDKSGHLEAEFQLNKCSRIDFIDIGNCGSSILEIQVGRSSFQSKTRYVSFLPAVNLASADAKEDNLNCVIMFNKSNFTSEAAEKKWDRIKVICSQPFRKRCQFGLSFLSLRCKEPLPPLTNNNNSPSQNENARLFSKHFLETDAKPKSKLPECTFSRGKQLVAMSKRLYPTPIRSHENDIVAPSFEGDVDCFLIVCIDEDTENKTLEEYMLDFEVQRQEKLNPAEKHIFSNKYFEIFHKNGLTSEYNTPNVMEQRNAAEVDLAAINASITLNDVYPNLCDSKMQISDEDEDKLRRLYSTVLVDPDPDDEPEIIAVKRKSSPDSNNNSQKRVRIRSKFLEPRVDEFVQVDGSEPSTSSGFTFVQCPICRERFPTKEIEKHAATCGDFPVTTSTIHNDYVSCPVCGELYPQNEMSDHIDICIERK